MLIENKIDSIIDMLVDSGSNKEELFKLRGRVLEYAKKDISLSEIIETIGNNVSNDTEEFLFKTNKDNLHYINGISSCIYLPDYQGNEIKYKVIGGYRNAFNARNKRIINEETIFDIASITKLFTLLLTLISENLGLSLDTPINVINQDFKLQDFTFNDLIKMCGEIRTQGRIDNATNKDEAYEILKTAYLYSDSRDTNKYTDLGAIIIGETLVKLLNQTRGVQYTFDEWMKKIVFDALDMKYTMFKPNHFNITGCGNRFEVHDPKARIMGGISGHAGIFTNSDDLCKLAKGIYNINKHCVGTGNRLDITEKQIKRLGEITFPNSPFCHKGNLGIYVKHPQGFVKTYTPSVFSNGSFAHQGWTGSVATFDPNNLIHQNILVNAIYDTNNKDLIKNDKVDGFTSAFDEYLAKFTDSTMLMYIMKKYYNIYIKRDNIDRSYTYKIRGNS